MIEKRMIEIAAYRTPKGAPTCAVDFDNGGICQFITSRKMGTVDVCAVCRVDIKRADGGTGYLVPVDGCPVWADAADLIELLRAELAEWRSVFGHLGATPDDCGNAIIEAQKVGV